MSRAYFHGVRLGLIGWLIVTGCVHRPGVEPGRPFQFGRDTFAFPNQTYWTYREDPVTGAMEHESRVPRPDYAHRCFVLVRAAKEFRLHAVFRPDQPRLTEREYRAKVRTVVRRSSRSAAEDGDRVEIPGYADLNEFSADHGAILKEGLGGAWQSYTQRGHWRILFPFSETHQRQVAERLQAKLETGEVAAVHVIRFPELSINHAVLAFAARSDADAIHFQAYDPNDAEAAIDLIFDRKTGRFEMPRTPYFIGGTVDAYEVYRSAWY